MPVGNLALAMAIGAPVQMLRRVTYVGNTREREIIQTKDNVKKTERHLPLVYAPSESGLLGHVIFSLKHEVPHLGLLAAVFQTISEKDIAAHIKNSPTGAYARRIGFLYELLMGKNLTPFLKGVVIGGNYVELLDSAKLVTAIPTRNARWRILDNIPGSGKYAAMVERTEAVEHALRHDWQREISRALETSDNDAGLLHRALNYLYMKETRSSFAIERESPSEARATRFVEALKQAGQSSTEDTLDESNLSALQNLIVDPRFAEKGFRKIQNYVGATVHWKTVVHFIPPPPGALKEMMHGWADAVNRLGASEPVAQAAVASFGFVFLHPFTDGNGRVHRYLLHDFLTRNRITPGGTALPISSAILSDMGGYDSALEAYSGIVERLVSYTMNMSDEMTVTNAQSVDWVWRFPDLTAQVEYLGQALKRSVEMVAEEITYLARYDALLARVRSIVDMPDRRLANLLVQIHSNAGKLSRNKWKQRFHELTDDEIAQIEAAYADVFGESGSDAYP